VLFHAFQFILARYIKLFFFLSDCVQLIKHSPYWRVPREYSDRYETFMVKLFIYFCKYVFLMLFRCFANYFLQRYQTYDTFFCITFNFFSVSFNTIVICDFTPLISDVVTSEYRVIPLSRYATELLPGILASIRGTSDRASLRIAKRTEYRSRNFNLRNLRVCM